jgi:hypothetical protein
MFWRIHEKWDAQLHVDLSVTKVQKCVTDTHNAKALGLLYWYLQISDLATGLGYTGHE